MRHEQIIIEGRVQRGPSAKSADAMSVLQVRNLKVRYTASGPNILKGIDFEDDGDDF